MSISLLLLLFRLIGRELESSLSKGVKLSISYSLLIKVFKSYLSTFDLAQSKILNVVPFPNSLWTVISPPIYLTIFLLIESPRPVPCLFILDCSSNLLNYKNNLSKFSSLIPIPESDISILKCTKAFIYLD